MKYNSRKDKFLDNNDDQDDDDDDGDDDDDDGNELCKCMLQLQSKSQNLLNYLNHLRQAT